MGKAPQFRNFDLAIGARDKDGFYSVSVLGSPAGETTAPVPISNPQSDTAIVTQLAELHDGSIAAPELQALGQRLMNFLLPPGPVQDLFAQSVLLAASQDARIRMRLRIAAQELATLPWEYAFHPGQGEFLALDSTIAVLRYHSQPMPPRAVASLAPLPLLIVGANPAKLANLKAADEIIGVISSISPLLRSGRATVDILFGGSPEDREEIGRRISGLPAATLLHPSATIDAVRNTLRGGHRMLHFIGHGAFTPGESGLLLLLDEAGDAHPVAAQTLARELRDSSIAVVLLNACQGAVDDTNKSFVGVAPGLVRAGIPAVIAMQGAISDKAALRFSQGLYAAIADGWPLDAAVTQGRLAISSAVESSAEWGIPVLFMRSSDGVLWVEPSSVSPAQLAADFGRMVERVEQAIQHTKLNDDAQPDLLAGGVQRYTQGLQTLMQHAGDSGASGPYKGLLEYRLQDAELFAGRAAQTAGLLEQIQRGPLTILHSESGAGKTSLLQAGVAPRLIAAGHLPVLIRPYNVDPALALKRVFIPNLEENPDLAALPVGEFLARACRALGPGSRMFVFVDQFEEFFTELHPDAQRAFVAQLARCVDDPLLPVHWVFAMRREYFSRMEMFRPQIRNPFGNDFLLLRLTMDEAREAITQPAARFGITWDRELVEALLSDLGENEIAPPQAQLVCQALIDELAEGNTEVTRTLYGRLGGASGILRGHLERVLTRNVPPAQRRVAHAILEAMVTSDSRRVMASREDLVSHLAGRKLPADGLDAVLAQLVDSRLVRTSERDAVDGSGVSETAFHPKPQGSAGIAQSGAVELAGGGRADGRANAGGSSGPA